jgi:putative FmdB family regulatory protein
MVPIYEYQCDTCENVFEELILGSEDDPDTCPECGKKGVHRVMSNTSFQLKGEGWYVTDYKSSPAPPKESTTADTPSTTDEASSESEAKPAESGTKSDSKATSTDDTSAA